MSHLWEIFARPVTGAGLRGDCLLPPERMGPVAGPAAFYHPDQVRDDHGRWAGGDFDPRQSFGDSANRPSRELVADDLPEPVRAQATAWAAKLTPDERGALQSYVYFGYQEMNRAMAAAGGDPRKVPNYGYFGDPGRRLHLLADAADKHPPLETPLTGWRFMASKPERMAAFVAAADAAAATGGELTMPVFGSTTLNPEKAVASSTAVNVAIQKDRERDTVLLEITSRTGLLLGPAGFSDNPALEQEENEVLQRPTARYRVLGWKDVNFGSEKRRVLRLDEIPPETPRPTPVEPPTPAAPPAPPPPPPPPPPGLWGRLKKAVGFSEWDPDKHPRGEHGQFGPGGSAASAPAPAPAPASVGVWDGGVWFPGGKPQAVRAVASSAPVREILTPLKPQDLEGDTPLGEFTRRGRAWAGRLDKAAFGALKAYTGVNYRGINKALRKSPDLDGPEVGEKARKWAKRLQAALATHSPTPAPVTSYRGIKTTAKSKLPKIEAGFAAALASGEPVTLNGFSSATLDPSYAAKWTPAGRGLVLELKSRRGVYIASASHMPQEEEVLHTHASQFKVTGVRKVEYQTPAGSRIHTTYTLEEVEPPRPAARPPGPPAQFDWDPDKHPRGSAGRWATVEERLGVSGDTAAAASGPAPSGYAPVAAYVRGRALAAAVAALPHATGDAIAKVAAAKAAFKQWPKDNPDGREYGPEHSALWRAVEAAEADEAVARGRDREAFLAAHGAVQTPRWAPDTADCTPRNKAAFGDAMSFVGRLVSAGTGVDPRFQVADDRSGPSYTPAVRPDEVGYLAAKPRTPPVAFAHELGHHVEFTAPGAVDLANEFLDHRAAGETPRPLADMGLTQDETATGVKDHFDRVFGPKAAYYVGRRYDNTRGTELTAMGVEALYDDPVAFAKRDPEYFAFVIGILSGDLLNKGDGHAR